MEGLRQDRIRPILPFEPVRCVGDAHEMRGNLWIQMGGHRDARSARDRRRTHPTAYTANAHHVGHDVVARTGEQCLIQEPRTVEILPELNWGFQFTRKLA